MRYSTRSANTSATRQLSPTLDHQRALRPLTIRQILKTERAHSTAPFVLDGEIELAEIMIVAHLVSAETSSSFTVYQLEDGTGRISAREWFSDDHSRSNIDPRSTKGHRYVRIIGTVDQFRDGAKSIKVTFIRECPDPHEAYYHFLECCAVSLLQQTGTIPPTSSTAYPLPRTSRDMAMEGSTVEGLSSLSLDDSRTLPQRPFYLSSDPLSHLSNLQRGIIQAILNGTSTAAGVPVVVIAQAVGYIVRTPVEISDALDFLLDEGYIICPVDIHHYALTAKCLLPQGQYCIPVD